MNLRKKKKLISIELEDVPKSNPRRVRFRDPFWFFQITFDVVAIFIILMLVSIVLHYQDKIENLHEKLSKRAPPHCSQIHQQNRNRTTQIIQTTATSTTTAVPTTTTVSSNYDMQLLFVATGIYDSVYLKSVEIINLDPTNQNLICDSIPDFPVGFYSGTGQLLNGNVPMICGGCDCYIFQNSTWIETASVNNCRFYASSVALSSNASLNSSQEMIIAGGFYYNVLSDLETFNGSRWVDGIISQLPYPVYDHCMVKLNESAFISIGGLNYTSGSTGKSTNRTFIYNMDTGTWTSGPILLVPRFGHSCGGMTWTPPNSNRSERVIVVAGGYNYIDGNLASVELLFLNRKTGLKWIYGPSLHTNSWGATLVEYGKSVILVGGSGTVEDSRHMYQLDSPEATFWRELPQHLTDARYGHVAFMVSKDIVNCQQI